MIGPCSGLFGLYGFENGKRCRHVNFYCQLILKSQKNYENLDFSTCGLCLAFKIFLAFYQFSWPSDILNIQNYSNLNYFEAILPLKQFLLKNWQTGSVCVAQRRKLALFGLSSRIYEDILRTKNTQKNASFCYGCSCYCLFLL